MLSSKSTSGAIRSLIALYDSECRIVWISETPPPYQRESVIGSPPWTRLPDRHQADRLQAALLRVLVSRETQVVDIAWPHVGTWRMSLHHVALHEVRIAESAIRIPPHLLLLTDTEKRICKLLADGNHTPEIADALDVSRSTISAHRAHIARKLTIATDELVSWCGAHKEWF